MTMMHLGQLPEGGLRLLDAEAVFCAPHPTDHCRVVLLAGLCPTEDNAACLGLLLHEQTVAALWACACSGVTLRPHRASPLYNLRLHLTTAEWAAGPLAGLIQPLRRLRRLTPDHFQPLASSPNSDDALRMVGLGGRDEDDGTAAGYLLPVAHIQTAWNILLAGPGAYVVAGDRQARYAHLGRRWQGRLLGRPA